MNKELFRKMGFYRIIGVAATAGSFATAAAHHALAADPPAATGGLGSATDKLNKLNSKAGLASGDLVDMIGTLISTALGLLGIILVVLIIYAGWLWMSAQGDSDQVQKAKDIMKNAIIGLIITAAAFAISSFVFTLLPSTTAPAA